MDIRKIICTNAINQLALDTVDSSGVTHYSRSTRATVTDGLTPQHGDGHHASSLASPAVAPDDRPVRPGIAYLAGKWPATSWRAEWVPMNMDAHHTPHPTNAAYPVHAIDSAPAAAKPALVGLRQAIGFVPNLP